MIGKFFTLNNKRLHITTNDAKFECCLNDVMINPNTICHDIANKGHKINLWVDDMPLEHQMQVDPDLLFRSKTPEREVVLLEDNEADSVKSEERSSDEMDQDDSSFVAEESSDDQIEEVKKKKPSPAPRKRKRSDATLVNDIININKNCSPDPVEEDDEDDPSPSQGSVHLQNGEEVKHKYESIFTRAFDENKVIATSEFLEFRSGEENAGKFGKWMVDGMKKFEKKGFEAFDVQIKSVERLLAKYMGSDIVFGAYGYCLCLYMGMGKTLVLLVFIMLVARLRMPGKRLPSFDDDYTKWMEIIGPLMSKDPKKKTMLKLLQGGMFTEQLSQYIPNNTFKAIPNVGHALVVMPKGVIESWLLDIKNYFTKNSIKYIDLMNDVDDYLKNYRLFNEIPQVHIVFIGEARLQMIHRNIMKRNFTEFGVQKAQMPHISERITTEYQYGLGAIFGYGWHTLIIDEVQSFTNQNTCRFAAAMDIVAHVRVASTGTPIKNKLKDLQSLFIQIGIKHPIVNDDKTFDQYIDVYREHEKKKLTIKLIDDVTNQFQHKVAVAREESVALKKDQIKENVKMILTTNSLLRYNPYDNLCPLYIAKLTELLNESIKKKMQDDPSLVMPEYDVRALFETLYPLYLDGKFGVDGKGMITDEYPLLPGKDISRRADHKAILNGKTNRPMWLDACQKIRFASDYMQKISEIQQLEGMLKNKSQATNTGMYEDIFDSILTNVWEDTEKRLAELRAALSTAEDLSKYKPIWKMENGMIYDMFYSYTKIMNFYTEHHTEWKKDVEPTYRIVDAVSLGVMLYHKYKSDEDFRITWNDAESNCGCFASELIAPSVNMTNIESMIEAIDKNPVGLIMEKSVLRYGRETLYNMQFQKAIEAKKEELGGRDLTDEELKEVSDWCMERYGLLEVNIYSDFLDERERIVYEVVRSQSLEGYRNSLTVSKANASAKSMRLFTILTKLREVATDGRILVNSPSVQPLLLMDELMCKDIIRKKKPRKRRRKDADEEEEEVDMSVIDDEQKEKMEYWTDVTEIIGSITNFTKMKMLDSLLRDPQRIRPGAKVLIFTYFSIFIPILIDFLDDLYGYNACVYMNGDSSSADRKKAQAKFKNDEKIKVFILTFGTGNAGLNLQEAEYVIIYDGWWNPQVEEQAVDRAHRTGKKCKTIVYRLFIKNTIEDKMVEIKEKKLKIADKIMGSNDKPYVLPTKAEIMSSGKLSVEAILNLISGDTQPEMLDKFNDMVKNRNKKRIRRDIVQQPKEPQFKQTKIDPSNWIVKKDKAISPNISIENIDDVCKEMAKKLDDSF